LQFKGADIDPAAYYPIKTGTALVEQWRRRKIRVACIDRRAARQQSMRECRPAVILQRANHRIRKSLIARSSQNPASIIATNVVAQRHHRAVAIRIDILT
jgi:hypothetical protein